MKEKFKQTLSRASEVVFRYPLVLLMAILTSAGTILMFENNNLDEVSFNYSKYTICFCIGISLMFGIKMLSQRIGKSVLLHSVGILFLLGFYFIFPRREDDFTEVYGYIIAVTVLLTHLLVSFKGILLYHYSAYYSIIHRHIYKNLRIRVYRAEVFCTGSGIVDFMSGDLFYNQ